MEEFRATLEQQGSCRLNFALSSSFLSNDPDSFKSLDSNAESVHETETETESARTHAYKSINRTLHYKNFMKEDFIIGAKEDIPGLVFNKMKRNFHYGRSEKVELSGVSVLFQSAVAREELEKSVIQSVVMGTTNHSWSGASAESGSGSGSGSGSTVPVRGSSPKKKKTFLQLTKKHKKKKLLRDTRIVKRRLRIGVCNSHTMISEFKIDLHLGDGNNELISIDEDTFPVDHVCKHPLCALVCWLEFTLDVPDSTKSSKLLSKEIKYSQKVVSAFCQAHIPFDGGHEGNCNSYQNNTQTIVEMRLTSDEKLYGAMQFLRGPINFLNLSSERAIPIVKFKMLMRSDPIDEHDDSTCDSELDSNAASISPIDSGKVESKLSDSENVVNSSDYSQQLSLKSNLDDFDHAPECKEDLDPNLTVTRTPITIECQTSKPSKIQEVTSTITCEHGIQCKLDNFRREVKIDSSTNTIMERKSINEEEKGGEDGITHNDISSQDECCGKSSLAPSKEFEINKLGQNEHSTSDSKPTNEDDTHHYQEEFRFQSDKKDIDGEKEVDSATNKKGALHTCDEYARLLSEEDEDLKNFMHHATRVATSRKSTHTKEEPYSSKLPFFMTLLEKSYHGEFRGEVMKSIITEFRRREKQDAFIQCHLQTLGSNDANDNCLNNKTN